MHFLHVLQFNTEFDLRRIYKWEDADYDSMNDYLSSVDWQSMLISICMVFGLILRITLKITCDKKQTDSKQTLSGTSLLRALGQYHFHHPTSQQMQENYSTGLPSVCLQ